MYVLFVGALVSKNYLFASKRNESKQDSLRLLFTFLRNKRMGCTGFASNFFSFQTKRGKTGFVLLPFCLFKRIFPSIFSLRFASQIYLLCLISLLYFFFALFLFGISLFASICFHIFFSVSVLARQPSRAADPLLRFSRGGGTPSVYWQAGGGDLHI
jgi:hypothetical protein